MDDGKRENIETKRPKSDNVKSIVSVYINRRQVVGIKPRIITKNMAIKRAVLDNRLRKPNSILYNFINESESLLIQYSLIFQKFMHWLKDQTNKKHQCHDIENLVGPLFCHLYMDIRSSGKPHEAIAASTSFFKSNIDKIDTTKCDDYVKDLLQAISTSDNIVLNGSDSSNFNDVKEYFRSRKCVAHVKPKSLMLLKNFIADCTNLESQVVLLQALQSWFDFKVLSDLIDDSICSESRQRLTDQTFDDNMNMKNGTNWLDFNSLNVPHENITDITKQKIKLQNVIKKTRKLPANVCNIRILNNKFRVTCGLIRNNANLAVFCEKNILRVMPLQVLTDSLGSFEQVDHVRFIYHSRQIYCVALCSENDIICTGSADHSICIYSLCKIKFIKRLWGHLGPVYCVSISENLKYLASGSHDGTVRLWTLKTGKPLRVFSGHLDAVTTLHFHPNSLYLATGSADRNVRVWCLNNANTVRLLHAAKREIYAVAFSPNGQYIACASDDKKVRIWDLSSSKVAYELKNRESSVNHLIWSKSGKQLCGGTVSGIVKIWDLKNKDNEHGKEQKHVESVLRRPVNGQLLCVDYTVGTWTCLSVPRHSPFDNILYKSK